MRKAFLVGISTYSEQGLNLSGPVNDIDMLKPLIHRNSDKSNNYEVLSWRDKTDNGQPITRGRLLRAISELFLHEDDVIFYFSGHGYVNELGGYLVTYDADSMGVSMDEVINAANNSNCRSALIIIDACHSGYAAKLSGKGNLSLIKENHVVIAASKANESAYEVDGRGLFTTALIDGLEGGAANHDGQITAPALYTYISSRFRAWSQRVVLKANLTDTPIIRHSKASLDPEKLIRLTDFFKDMNDKFPLDAEYEPEDDQGGFHEPVNQEKFALSRLFKEYRDNGLIRPTAPQKDLFWAARNNGTIELTAKGKEVLVLLQRGLL